MNWLCKKIRRLRRKRKTQYIVREFRKTAALVGIDLSNKSDFLVLLIAARTSRWMAEVDKALKLSMQQIAEAFESLVAAMIEVGQMPTKGLSKKTLKKLSSMHNLKEGK